MSKTLSISLFTTPYTFENTYSALRLAEAALNKGYQVKFFAYADGVHNFTTNQKARGIPNAETLFSQLIERGLEVELCGTCLHFRGIGKDQLMEGAAPSSMRNLCEIIKTSDVFITLAF
ncbi:MAG: DsrE family protein [Firmicutes bacterium]|nr:DsrE family protein [Bacillota bacterium]MCL5039282.1 DsrE family protein [Bacillota bacterium]